MELAAIEKGGYDHFMIRKYLSNHKRYLTVFAAVLMQSMAPSK